MAEHSRTASARKLRSVDGFLAAVIHYHLGLGVKKEEFECFREGAGYIGANEYSCYEHIALRRKRICSVLYGCIIWQRRLGAFRDITISILVSLLCITAGFRYPAYDDYGAGIVQAISALLDRFRGQRSHRNLRF